MGDEQTLPTIQTLLEEMRAGFAAVDKRLSIIETQLENMDIRLDRIEGHSNQTRSEVLNLRADFKEFRSRFNQPA